MCVHVQQLKISHHCAVLCIYYSHISMLMVTARLGALDKATGRKGMERDRKHSLLDAVWKEREPSFLPLS